jgi:rod shape-determining protein MreD
VFQKVFPFLLVLFGVLIDVSIIPVFSESPILPVISLCIVVSLGMARGHMRGMLYGLLAGLLLDVTVCNPMGLMTIVYTLAGYLAGFTYGGKKRSLLRVFLLPLAAIALYEFSMMGYLYVVSGSLMLGDGASVALRVALGAVLMQGLYFIFAALFGPKRSQYV